MNSKINKGISVIVCCYNSASRIGKTLSNLSKQEIDPNVSWELVIVDNNSSDHTAELAREIWTELDPVADLRIVYEPMPGLVNARRKGIAESSYAFLLFCDDDNWLAENYVQGMYDLLDSDPDIAACGGMGVPVFESEEPSWFDEYAEAFALGSQEITMENGCLLNLYGAGMAVKRSVIEEMYRRGFNQILQDRIGNTLSSAGDTELTYAMVLAGYRLACTDDLKFFHYLPKDRLTLDYLKRLFTAFGTDGPVRNLYYGYISERKLHKFIRNWNIHFALSLFRLGKYLIVPPKKHGRSIYFQWSIAYIRQLLVMRKNYAALKEQICNIRDTVHHGSLQAISKKSGHVMETPRSL